MKPLFFALKDGLLVPVADEGLPMSKLSNPWSWSPGADDEYTAAIQAAYERGHQAGFQTGLATGELAGRIAIANELEAQFGPDSGHDMDATVARRVRLKQVH